MLSFQGQSKMRISAGLDEHYLEWQAIGGIEP